MHFFGTVMTYCHQILIFEPGDFKAAHFQETGVNEITLICVSFQTPSAVNRIKLLLQDKPECVSRLIRVIDRRLACLLLIIIFCRRCCWIIG